MMVNDAPRAADTGGPSQGAPALKRSLKLWHAVLYGLGVTIGAGIYVLVADAAGRAGLNAPVSFLVTAVLVGLTGASLAELGSRFPVAAGEAEYVRRGFRSDRMGAAIGALVIAMAIVSAATISVGAAGYIRVFVGLPEAAVIAAVVLTMGYVATRRVVESVTFAGVMTLIEIGGLLLIVGAGLAVEPGVVTRMPEMLPMSLDAAVWSGIMTAAMLAVFAFVGFEGIVNIAEEMEAPERNLPRAILLTLVVTTVLYVLVAWVSLVALGPQALAGAKAPLAQVFERLTGLSPRIMSAIAVVATLNGIVVNLIMASRVMYGLARSGHLPRRLATLDAATATPLPATALATAIVLVLAVALPIGQLADLSSRITLVVFGLVNVALVLVKRAETTPPAGIFVAPWWAPVGGAAACALFLAVDVARVLGR
jgi:amino acid transporter